MDFDKFYSSLTPDERAYLIAVTDIFHDSPYNVIGRPSLSNQLQNTTTINLERTFSNTDFGLAGNWDCNFVSLPFITPTFLNSCNDAGFEVISPTATPHSNLIGGVVVSGATPGAPTFMPGSTNTSVNALNYFFPNWTSSGTYPINRVFYEILSIGLEIQNVTPDIYKGGTVVRYRLPTQGREANILQYHGGAYQPMTPFFCYPMPPTSSSQATAIPTSNIDKAAEGSYQMHTIQDQVSDYYISGNGGVFLSNADGTSTLDGNSWITDLDQTNPPLVRGDFDIVGSYFTGLTPETLLTLRYRIIVSTVPTTVNQQLLALAKTSPDANFKLESLISHLQAEFPAGVPVSMNPKGEWFKKVLKIGKKVLPKALPIVKDLAQGNIIGAAENTLNALKKDKDRIDKRVTTTDMSLQDMKKEMAEIKRIIKALAPNKLKA